MAQVRLPPAADIAWQVYAGAGRVVPTDYLGLHIRHWPIGVNFTCSFDAAGDLVNVSHNNRGNDNWRHMYFTTTGALPSPLVVGTQYWCLPVDATHVQVATTRGGAVIDIAGAGTGTHTVEMQTPTPQMNYGHIRLWDTGVYWGQINTANNTYDWSVLDELVATHLTEGRTITYCMGATPTWASSNPSGGSFGGQAGGRYPPVDIADAAGPLKKFVTALITRYNKASGGLYGSDATRIKYLETWNEPAFLGNDSGFYAGTPSELAQMAKAEYEATKAIDSAVMVHSPAFSDGTIFENTTTGRVGAWLNASDGAAGTGADWMDALAFHGYDKDYPDLDGSLDVDNWINDVLTVAGVSSPSTFPRYNSEWGYNVDQTAWIALTDAQRAGRLRQSMAIQAALGWKQTIPYAIGQWSGTGVNYLGSVVLVPEIDAAFNDVRWLAGKTMTNVAILTNGTLQFYADGNFTSWAP